MEHIFQFFFGEISFKVRSNAAKVTVVSYCMGVVFISSQFEEIACRVWIRLLSGLVAVTLVSITLLRGVMAAT